MRLFSIAFLSLSVVALQESRSVSQSGAVQASSPNGGVSASAAPVLICADAVADQDGGGCLSASSTATPGRLFPYPGTGNTYLAPSFAASGSGNEASGTCAFIGGGDRNLASADDSAIGGGYLNTTSGLGAAIVGGALNRAYGFYDAIGGGRDNLAQGRYSAVGGGRYNFVSGNTAAIGGGMSNQAQGAFAAVGGGRWNEASGDYAAVAGGFGADATAFCASSMGGFGSKATGSFSSALGGWLNVAEGEHSLAAGRRAQAHHKGAFVWGDSFDVAKPSSAADQFNVYASGGARIFSRATGEAGVLLASGSSVWSMVCDRDAKEKVEPVDGQDVLERLARVPIFVWSYRTQEGVRHMGPMAQDFHETFGLGLGPETIDAIDPDGVALAAIQGLHHLVKRELQALRAEKDAQIAELREEVRRLRQRTP